MEPRICDAEIVATVPDVPVLPFRSTLHVLREMLGGARDNVVALGYEMSHRDIIDMFHRAGRRAAITIVCDRTRESAPALKNAWPQDQLPPRLYQEKWRAAAGP